MGWQNLHILGRQKLFFKSFTTISPSFKTSFGCQSSNSVNHWNYHPIFPILQSLPFFLKIDTINIEGKRYLHLNHLYRKDTSSCCFHHRFRQWFFYWSLQMYVRMCLLLSATSNRRNCEERSDQKLQKKTMLVLHMLICHDALRFITMCFSLRYFVYNRVGW